MKTKLLISCLAVPRSLGHRRQFGAGDHGRRLGLLPVRRRWIPVHRRRDLMNTLDANYSDLVPDGPGAGRGRLRHDAPRRRVRLDRLAAGLVTDRLRSERRCDCGSLTSNLDAAARGHPLQLVRHSPAKDRRSPIRFSDDCTRPGHASSSKPTWARPEQGTTWSISFGGKTNEGTSVVGIEFSTDGTRILHQLRHREPHRGRHALQRGARRRPELTRPSCGSASTRRLASSRSSTTSRSTRPSCPSPPRRPCCSSASRGWLWPAAAAPDLRLPGDPRNRHPQVGVAVPASRSARCDSSA